MPREPIHLGEFLTDELEELGMSATALARIIQVPANRISQIIAGKRNLTADTAPRLGQYFGTGPQLWLTLQQAYELDLAQREIGHQIEAISARTANLEQYPNGLNRCGPIRSGKMALFFKMLEQLYPIG